MTPARVIQDTVLESRNVMDTVHVSPWLMSSSEIQVILTALALFSATSAEGTPDVTVEYMCTHVKNYRQG